MRTPLANDVAAPVEFVHTRYDVEPPLDTRIEHWWTVHWRFPDGVVQERMTLPHPSIHVAFEQHDDAGRARDTLDVVGVVRGRFLWRASGSGRVFAAKFRPGAFRALVDAAVATFTDQTVPLGDVVGKKAARAYRDALAADVDDHARVAVATTFFGALFDGRPDDRDAALLASLVNAATTDRSLTSVDELASRANLSKRALERWFHDVVGISPKWMLQRYRLHDALIALESTSSTLADVAASLGYADQAHFARDFKKLVGVSPSAYRARILQS